MQAAGVPAVVAVDVAKPEAAADAFIDAIASSDPVALKRVRRSDWAKLIPLGAADPAAAGQEGRVAL